MVREFIGRETGLALYRGEEIDLIAVRESDASVVFGECRWEISRKERPAACSRVSCRRRSTSGTTATP
ncbi:DUF234 domain-containing protein [Methanoculleus sp. UBA303]|uniref:DUF234 domain-containing protein n=1 Tax=Methanoculleus sp. UBA303 TaxID=1915497 RepID=UPI0025D55666|nr:DUF234 domain-containing protein [Methanoculleus sp. UBA303]